MKISYTRHAAGAVPGSSSILQLHGDHQAGSGPLVSCLMVTRGNPVLVSQALACFRAQTWQHKELVVVCERVTKELRELLKYDKQVRLIEVTQKLSLGDLRNLSVARSEGTYICQWDDDDLYDPTRIEVQMNVLMATCVQSTFLSRWLIWWPARDRLVLSSSRVWEGSMLAHRSVIPVYPSLPRREDSYVARWVTAHHPTALIDLPQLYCYRVTGENTWDEGHFERMFSRATKVFKDEEKRAMMKLPCFNVATR